MLDEQTRAETQILAVSPDRPEDSRDTIARVRKQFGVELDFPLLSDPDHQVIDRYGLLNPNGRGLPHPATYVIDREGQVVWRFVEVDYKIRAKNKDIAEALGKAR